VFPNLLHAQWACTGFWDGRATHKPIDFSFVGQIYGARAQQIRWLSRHAQLQAFGANTGRVSLDEQPVRGWLHRAKRAVQHAALRYILPGVARTLSTLDFEQVNQIWNTSKISFTPLDSSQGGVRQIKSRVFDMGLSRTLMLSQRAPYLDSYYEPDREYVPFETLEECVEKVRFYLRNEAARSKIAEAYAKRTEAEHLWSHRIQSVLRDAGIASGS
jgi:spore maturation protein CgeB